MFKTIDELKAFLLWAKKEKIDAVKVGDVEVHFNNTAMLDNITDLSEKTQEEHEVRKVVEEQLGEMPKNIDEDPDLYHSVG